jgi:hypothetical protein
LPRNLPEGGGGRTEREGRREGGREGEGELRRCLEEFIECRCNERLPSRESARTRHGTRACIRSARTLPLARLAARASVTNTSRGRPGVPRPLCAYVGVRVRARLCVLNALDFLEVVSRNDSVCPRSGARSLFDRLTRNSSRFAERPGIYQRDSVIPVFSLIHPHDARGNYASVAMQSRLHSWGISSRPG